jgi:putative membrane protein
MHRQKSLLKNLIAGSISGLVGTIAMTQFQNLRNKISENMGGEKTKAQSKQPEHEKEDSTMKTAGKVAEVAGHKLSPAERKKAGPWVHYAFGTTVGGIYGLVREVAPIAWHRVNPVAAGAGYGTAVFLGAHEVAVPALKLSSKPSQEPLPDHASEFVAHLVYGIGTALTYRLLRGI